MTLHRLLLALATMALLALAGCASQRAASTGPATPPGAALSPPPEAMAGRWLLAATGSSQCIMTFGGAPNAAEGTIAPEGGCPGNFFTSRKWTFEQEGLVIRDHTGAPLAQLAPAAPGRFEGKTTSGQQMTLTR